MKMMCAMANIVVVVVASIIQVIRVGWLRWCRCTQVRCKILMLLMLVNVISPHDIFVLVIIVFLFVGKIVCWCPVTVNRFIVLLVESSIFVLNGWINSYDKELPSELIFKCKPLFCELCSVKLNSAQQAKLHYEGKVHEKHSKHFLLTWARANNCVAPKVKNPFISNEEETPDNLPPNNNNNDNATTRKANLTSDDLYCQVCDLSFTSPIHANQHFGGRNHARKQ